MPWQRTITGAQADRWYEVLAELSRQMAHVLDGRTTASVGGGISPSRMQVLTLLSKSSGLTAGQIAGSLGISRPSATQLIRSLSSSGMVSRKGGVDRRECFLELTEHGRAVYRAVRGKRRQLLRLALRHLDWAEVKSHVDWLARFADVLVLAERACFEVCASCDAASNGKCSLVSSRSSICPEQTRLMRVEAECAQKQDSRVKKSGR